MASLTSPKSEFGAQNIDTILDAVAVVEEGQDDAKEVSSPGNVLDCLIGVSVRVVVVAVKNRMDFI